MADVKEQGLSLEEGVEGTIKLVSKDGVEKEVERKSAFVSNLIKTTLEQDSTASSIDLPSVDSKILEHIIEYMNHHKGVQQPLIDKPLRSKIMKDVCKDEWDAKFIDSIADTRSVLYEVILAANYLDIKPLLHLGCAKIASLIKGQPLDKIKDILSTTSSTPAPAPGSAEASA